MKGSFSAFKKIKKKNKTNAKKKKKTTLKNPHRSSSNITGTL